MLLKRAAVLPLLTLLVSDAVAAEPLDSRFEVTFSYSGQEQQVADTKVPLLPGNVCYTWFLQLPPDTPMASLQEKLILPVPLPDWGDAASNPDDGVDISADGTVATSTFTAELDPDGWMSKGWCAAPGDPLGPHRIEVSMGGELLHRFDFEVLAPEDYPWPAIIQPDPHERSVNGSW